LAQETFEFAKNNRKPYRGAVDYAELIEFMRHRPLTRGIIERLTGCPHGSVGEILDNLTFICPIYEDLDGSIKMLEAKK
jgi:hypothetical protein